MADIIDLVVGPGGAIVAVTAAAAALWRRHVKDVDSQLADKDATVAYERHRAEEAEERLDDLGSTLKDAADVMEKSVAVTEKAVAMAEVILKERGRDGRP